jgi:hypothetical protein
MGEGIPLTVRSAEWRGVVFLWADERNCFTHPWSCYYGPEASILVPGGEPAMNRFDREYWDGAREMALMFYETMRGRKDVPDDLRRLAETALRETGERKNRDFRDALGVVTSVPSNGSSKQPNGH